MAIAEIIEETDGYVKEKTAETFDHEVNEPSIQGNAELPPSIMLDNQSTKAAFKAFAALQSPSTSALISLFEPETTGNEIKVHMHKANMNMIEPIKVEWQKFLREHLQFDNLVLSLIEDDSVMEQTKAFTPREHLEELIRTNPAMREFVKKFNLKLK